MLQLCATVLNVTWVARLSLLKTGHVKKRHRTCCKKLAKVATPVKESALMLSKVQLKV